MAFLTETDGAVTVDSNVGTGDELKAEIASETAKPRGTGRAAPVVKVEEQGKPAGQPNPADRDEIHAGEDDEITTVAAEAGEPAAIPKKRHSVQARIDAIRSDLGNTQRERDASLRKVAELQAALDRVRGDPKAATAGAYDGVPFTEDEFPKWLKWSETHADQDFDDWTRADRKWERAKAQHGQEQQQAGAQETDRLLEPFRAASQSYWERIEPVLKADPQFYDKIDKRLQETPALSAIPGLIRQGVLPNDYKPTIGNFFVEQVIRSEMPDKLLVHLSDPKVLQRLMALPPNDIVRSLHEFEFRHRPSGADAGPSEEEQLEDEEGEATLPSRRGQAATYHEAEPPVKPARGSSQQSAGTEPDDDDSDDAFYRANRKKEAARLRSGDRSA